jgi:hypothetical protein
MSAPTQIVNVEQSYLIEALTSSSSPSSYLDYFPQEVYNTSSDSRLYKFLYALLGPAGVSFLKTNYFYARMQFEEHGLMFDQLDKLYANPLRFARTGNETYLENWKGMLSTDDWNTLKSLDESYRNRAIDYLHAARLGATVEGMRYAARSGLGHDAAILENYKNLFNQHSDQIFDYNFVGSYHVDGTQSVEEFIVIPIDNGSDAPVTIDAEAQHLVKSATDNLKPVNSVLTVQDGQAPVDILPIKSTAASSEYHQTIRYVTGAQNIPWPNSSDYSNDFNSIYWIEAGVEKESPRNLDGFQQHYQGFHTPISISASSEQHGQFGPEFTKKFATLKEANSLIASQTNYIWKGSDALADYAERLNVTTQNTVTNTNFINHMYPADYAGLTNVPSIKYQPAKFWSSAERDQGSETLEIDLGEEKAINFVIFDALKVPVTISIQYDAAGLIASDGSIQKQYKDVKFDSFFPNNQTLDYDPNSLNKWETLPYVFTDLNGNMIFTRYLKITFTRNVTTSLGQSRFLYDTTVTPPMQRPWSVVVNNLRLGRNV